MPKFLHLTIFFRITLSTLFIVTGASHFYFEAFFISIVPPYLPWPELLVALSGVAEIVCAIILLTERYRVVAKWGLIALLFAVFPANIHMAQHPELYPQFSSTVLWWRLPVQGILIAWVWMAGKGTDTEERVA